MWERGPDLKLSYFIKHLRIWRAFFRMSWMENLEYRLNFVSRFIVEIIWYSTQLVVFEVLYSHTHSIAGWEIEHVRVFMGSLFLSDCIWMMLFNENFDVFNAIDIMDNENFFDNLHFKKGSGILNYYLYNYTTSNINSSNLGLILP